MEFDYKNPKTLFHGSRIAILSVDVEHPKGGIIQREIVDHPGAVVILPFVDRETILLIRNSRYVIQQTLWELPAGTLEEDEIPEICAARELEEETGYRAKSISKLLEFFSTPGFCNEMLYTFVAQDLSYVGQNLDETETIDVEQVSLKKALKMIEEGVIKDAKTICSLLFYARFNSSLME